MPSLLLSIFRLVRLLMCGHEAIALENAALRLQLAAFHRTRKRPVLTGLDRVFWITFRRLWSGWRRPLIYVQADTVVRWQRERFADSGPGYRNRIAVIEAGPLLPQSFAK